MEELLSPPRRVLIGPDAVEGDPSMPPHVRTPVVFAHGSGSSRRCGLSSVDNDLHALQDQMHRCTANAGARPLVPLIALGATRRFLHRHLVSLIVLLALLSTVIAVGAPT